MVYDWNKKIQAISYNHLKLPVKISFYVGTGQRYIDYIYNAVGVKVGRRVFNSSTDSPAQDSNTEYLGGFQYQDNVLQFFPTAEGYVNAAGSAYNYVFNYTDHLGNVRLSYTKDPQSGELKVLEQSHYYPYGMKHANYNDNKHDYKEGTGGGYALIDAVERSNYQYKYNGKEYQDEFGLNLYDMDFRDYDPAIGRWTGIDPVTHHSQSPYNAFDGNPVFWADPSGADAAAYNTVMGLFNISGSGMTTYSHNEDGTITQTGYIPDSFFGAQETSTIGTLTYTLLSDSKNIHQVSFTQIIKLMTREVGSSVMPRTLIDYITVTNTIQIQLINREVIFKSVQVTTYGTSVFGGEGLDGCKECYTKSITTENSGLSLNVIANGAAEFIGNQIRVNPEYNLFNGEIKTSIANNVGTAFKGIKFLTDKVNPELLKKYPIIGRLSNGLVLYDWAQKGVNAWRNYRDNTGNSATYNVMSDGSIKFVGTNFKF